MKVFMLAALGFLPLCSSAPVGDAQSCARPVVYHGSACPLEIREWTRVQGSGPAAPQAVSNANGSIDYLAIQPGVCVYTDPCGVAWHVQGCYLADGYRCPR